MANGLQTKLLCIEHKTNNVKGFSDQLQDKFRLDSAANDEQALALLQAHGPYEAVVTDLPNDPLIFRTIDDLSPGSVRILMAEQSELVAARRAVQYGYVSRYIVQSGLTSEMVSSIEDALAENSRNIDKRQLIKEANRMIPANDRRYGASMFDTQLGVGSPEAMEIELDYSFNLALRYKRPFSIIAIDIDEYDEYVSHYGRKAAGLAHKLVAEHIRHSCRTVDRIFRCGADTSLLLLLPETLFEGANILAERVVSSFAQRNIPHSKSEHNVLTVSASPVAYQADKSDAKSWSELLDEALLYTNVAQGQGGNQVSHKAKIVEIAS